jgi:hypothetical protein
MKWNMLNNVAMICVLVLIIPIKYKYSTVEVERANVPVSVQTDQPEINADFSSAPILVQSNDEEMDTVDPDPPLLAKDADHETVAERSEFSAPAQIDDNEIGDDGLTSFARLQIQGEDLADNSFDLYNPGQHDADKVVMQVSEPDFSIFIRNPSKQEVFTEGYPKDIIGKAFVGGEALPEDSLVWESNLDGKIGTGSSISTEVLSIGEHTITLSVDDGSGIAISQSIFIKKINRPIISVIEAESTIDREKSKRSNGPLLMDNGDDTLTNINTDLMWQKRITSSQLNWQNACSYCDHLNFAGYDDWRLPEAHEYFELVNGQGSTISRDFNNYSIQQWTQTNYPKKNQYLLTVEFEYFIKYKGFIPRSTPAYKNAKHFVRCVR